MTDALVKVTKKDIGFVDFVHEDEVSVYEQAGWVVEKQASPKKTVKANKQETAGGKK